MMPALMCVDKHHFEWRRVVDWSAARGAKIDLDGFARLQSLERR